EETKASSDQELDSLRKLFESADVFIWLPEVHQGNRPALARALIEWLDARRGRAVHFHWNSGSYPIGFHELPPQNFIDGLYLAALDEILRRQLDRKSTRLNSSHVATSYAVFCLKKKNRYVCTFDKITTTAPSMVP